MREGDLPHRLRLWSPARRWTAFAAACWALTLVGTVTAVAAPRDRIAVYRSATGEWLIRGDDGGTTRVKFGEPGDLPVPRDYDGQGRAQIAVYRPVTGEWFIRQDDGRTLRAVFGAPGDAVVPGDYLGLGRCQLACFRPSTGHWLIRLDDGRPVQVQWGLPTDLPVAGDFAGGGRQRIAVFRPMTAEWRFRADDGTGSQVVFGLPGDIPVAAAYDETGRTKIAVFRPSSQTWYLRNDDGSPAAVQFGGPGDQPVPGDYDGIGRARIAVFRAQTGEWFLRQDDGSALAVRWGGPGDIPVAAAYSTVFRAATAPDTILPTTIASLSPVPRPSGWNNSDVTVTLTAAGPPGGTGIKEITYVAGGAQTLPSKTVSGASVAVKLTAEGQTTLTYFARDSAGNLEAPKTLTIRIDKTLPVVRVARTGDPNAGNWYNATMTAGFTATDALSGIEGATSDRVVFDQEGADQSASRTFIDRAGNAATASVSGIHLDRTPPTLTFGTATPAPNAAGWNNSDVSIPFTAADAVSGVASTAPAAGVLALTVQGAAVSGKVTVTDKAGNTATFTSPPFKIDKTAPVLTASRSPAARGGWHNTSVTVTFTATDAVSGVAGASDPVTLTEEGMDQSGTGRATDVAGNAASVTVSGIHIDKTPPTLTFGAAIPASNAAGWNNTDLAVPFTAADNLSGVAATNPTPSPLVLTAEGAAVTGPVTVTDKAGNTATFTSPPFKIDKRPPTVTYTGNAGPYTVDERVRITRSISDNLSGVSASSGEDVDSPAYALSLGSHRLTAIATDQAGNTGTGTTSFTILVTYDSLTNLTRQFVEQTEVANLLAASLTAARAADARGDTGAKAGAIADYIAKVSIRRDTYLTSARADVLIALARAL